MLVVNEYECPSCVFRFTEIDHHNTPNTGFEKCPRCKVMSPRIFQRELDHKRPSPGFEMLLYVIAFCLVAAVGKFLYG